LADAARKAAVTKINPVIRMGTYLGIIGKRSNPARPHSPAHEGISS
jgi:hypothetical protein